jgi:hypothetical protein
VIYPDQAAKLRSGVRFDRIVASVIGVIAVLAAVLGVVHNERSLASTHAQLMASRLAADISARIAIRSVAGNLTFSSDEAVLLLEREGNDRALAAAQADNAGAAAVGGAMYDASKQLKAQLAATGATTGAPPLDGYAANLIETTPEEFEAELAEQSRQVDLANDAGWHDRIAIMGLSFLALAGVLAGLAAVLREGRAGWIVVRVAAGIAGLTALLVLLAIF